MLTGTRKPASAEAWRAPGLLSQPPSSDLVCLARRGRWGTGPWLMLPGAWGGAGNVGSRGTAARAGLMVSTLLQRLCRYLWTQVGRHRAGRGHRGGCTRSASSSEKWGCVGGPRPLVVSRAAGPQQADSWVVSGGKQASRKGGGEGGRAWFCSSAAGSGWGQGAGAGWPGGQLADRRRRPACVVCSVGGPCVSPGWSRP